MVLPFSFNDHTQIPAEESLIGINNECGRNGLAIRDWRCLDWNDYSGINQYLDVLDVDTTNSQTSLAFSLSINTLGKGENPTYCDILKISNPSLQIYITTNV